MGLRVRKRIKIANGIHLNVGKKGTSLSIGKRGASVNIGKSGVTTTVGLPGTGLSYSSKIAKPSQGKKISPKYSQTKGITNTQYIVLASLIGGTIGALLAQGAGAFLGAIISALAMALAGERNQNNHKTIANKPNETITDKPNKTIPANINTISIQSFTDPTIIYSIDPTLISCTCPDFSDRRSRFAADDPRRLCKHLIQVVSSKPSIFDHYSVYREEIEKCNNNKKGFYAKPLRNLISADGHILAVYTEEKPNEYNDGEGRWMDVFFKGIKHGYNPVKNIWTRTFPKSSDRDSITTFIRKEICQFDEEFC